MVVVSTRTVSLFLMILKNVLLSYCFRQNNEILHLSLFSPIEIANFFSILNRDYQQFQNQTKYIVLFRSKLASRPSRTPVGMWT